MIQLGWDFIFQKVKPFFKAYKLLLSFGLLTDYFNAVHKASSFGSSAHDHSSVKSWDLFNDNSLSGNIDSTFGAVKRLFLILIQKISESVLGLFVGMIETF